MRCSDHSLRLRRTPGIEVAGSPWWPGMRDTRWESGTTDVVRFARGEPAALVVSWGVNVSRS